MEIEKIIAELKEQGKTDEEILGVFTEALEQAKEILGGNKPTEEEEKKEAEKLFGMEL